jgi:hypothetical protein
VQHQSARIDVPDDWNLVTVQVKLGRLGRSPVGSKLGEFTNNQRFDVRTGGFFIVKIGPDVTDVRIG